VGWKKRYGHWSQTKKMLSERADKFEKPPEARYKEFMKANGQFVEAFNRWLEGIRTHT